MPQHLARLCWRSLRPGPALRFLVGRRARLASPCSCFYFCSCKFVLSLGVRLRNFSQPDHPMLSLRRTRRRQSTPVADSGKTERHNPASPEALGVVLIVNPRDLQRTFSLKSDLGYSSNRARLARSRQRISGHRGCTGRPKAVLGVFSRNRTTKSGPVGNDLRCSQLVVTACLSLQSTTLARWLLGLI